MPMDTANAEAQGPDALYPISFRTKQRLALLAPEGNIATLEEATTIIKILLKDSGLSNTPQNITFHVLHLHLRSLVFQSMEKRHPLTEIFRKCQDASVQKICDSLHRVAEKYTSLKRKFTRVWNFLKTRNIRLFIRENAQHSERKIERSPPLTLRRGPDCRKHIRFSYA